MDNVKIQSPNFKKNPNVNCKLGNFFKCCLFEIEAFGICSSFEAYLLGMDFALEL